MGLFSNSLRLSGYPYKFRLELINGILKRRKQLDMDVQKGTPRYRNRAEIEQHKAERKDNHLATWFLRGNNTSVMQIQATPEGKLAKLVKDSLRGYKAPDGGTTMVIEMGGSSVLAGMSKPDPFLSSGCLFPEECPVDPKHNCWGSKVVYDLECEVCGAQYVGTTGHSLHKRILEHEKAVRRSDQSNSMAKHYCTAHPEVDKANNKLFNAKIIGTSNITHNIVRYITEAATIEDRVNKGDNIVNSRGEWGRVQLRRLAVISAGNLQN